jgi:hypothetical protein
MANRRYGVTGDIDQYSFSLAGRYIAVGAIDTPLPSIVQPIDDLAMPAGWTNLGPTENGEVTMNLSLTVEDINTGVVATSRRKIITEQTGTIESVLHIYTPENFRDSFGVDITTTPSTSLNREMVNLWLGGTLGDIIACMIVEDFDIDLVDDPGDESYEQVIFYSPRIQKNGDVDLSRKIGRTPAVNFNYGLLGFTNAGAAGRTVLIQQRWLKAA